MLYITLDILSSFLGYCKKQYLTFKWKVESIHVQEKATIKVSENILKMLKEEDNFSSMDETIII